MKDSESKIKHSGPGIASFAASAVSLFSLAGMMVFSIFFRELSETATTLVGVFIVIGVPLAFALGLAGILQKDRRKLFPTLGISLSLLLVLFFGVAIYLGLHQDVDDAEQAVAKAHKAIERSPNDAKAHHHLGAALSNQGDLEKAIESYSRAIELDPDLALAHNNLGNALREQDQEGDLEKAIESYSRAIKLDPAFAKAHLSLGDALRQRDQAGDLEKAIESFSRAIKLDPDNLPAMINLAKIHGRLEQIDRSGVWLARYCLAKGDSVVDDASMVTKIANGFTELKIRFPSAEAPSDEAIADYYENHSEVFRDSAVHLRMLSVAKSSATRDFMGTLREKLIDGADFATMAKDRSDDSAASDGGDRGWIKRGTLRVDLDEVAFALKAGEFSEVVEDDTHFRLLNVVERKPGELPPLGKVRYQVVASLKEEARTAKIQSWIEAAKQELAAERGASGKAGD